MVPQALMAARRQIVSQIECLRQLPMLPIGSPPTESPKRQQQSNQCTQSKPQQSIQANETTKTIKSRRKETNAWEECLTQMLETNAWAKTVWGTKFVGVRSSSDVDYGSDDNMCDDHASHCACVMQWLQLITAVQNFILPANESRYRNFHCRSHLYICSSDQEECMPIVGVDPICLRLNVACFGISYSKN